MSERKKLQEELIREIENWICEPLQNAYTITGVVADRIMKLLAENAELKKQIESMKCSGNCIKKSDIDEDY